MKIFRIKNSSESSRYSLSIDPGIKSSGFCFLDKKTGKVITKTFLRENLLTRVNFPLLFILSKEMMNLYLEELNNLDWSYNFQELELNLEYTFTPGSFAASLNTQITYVISKFLALGINQVTMVPTKIPGFFLQVGNKTIDEALLEKWFEVYLPNFKTDSTHARDALMISLFCHFNLYSSYHNIEELRKPEIELISLDY